MSDLNFYEERCRSKAVNEKRCQMPCFFDDGLTPDRFEAMANRAARKIKRVKHVCVKGAIIYCTVESQTGYSDWDFCVDFNNWGHITGTYWAKTDNKDSSIPRHFGQVVSEWIHDFYRERGISLRDFSDYVDQNTDLETSHGLRYSYKKKLLERLWGGSKNNISITYGSDDIVGEHLYPVISILRNTGFKNIKTFSVKDINDKSSGYLYQVEQVVIAGASHLEYGMCFSETAEVLIVYHEKQTICMPFSQSELKRKNFITVCDKLLDQGFTRIYERKIEDLITGWLVKDGSVESVLINGNENTPIEKNTMYDFDQEITICYHTKKRPKVR